MAKKDKQSEALKEKIEKEVLLMLDNPDIFTAQRRMNLKLAIDYAKVKVAWEDDFGTGFAEALKDDAAEGPGEGEFAPPSTEERAAPSLLSQLETEQADG